MRDPSRQGNLIAAHSRRKTIASKTSAPTTMSPILTNHLAAGRLQHVLGAADPSVG